MKYSLCITIFILGLGACNTPGPNRNEKVDYIKTETLEEKNERMQWWRDAGFGMFIHWGLYSVPAGQYGEEKNHAEWIQETANIPVEEYEKYTSQFNPVNYNAAEWVRMAREAGMKYIVITSKHHDGFCLWNSEVSDYDMESTPYKKDLLLDLAEACKKEGVKLCFYHSIMDWHHPQAQGINYPDYNHGTGPNPEFSSYVNEYMYPQLKELLSRYGDIGVLWFDGEWITEWTEEQGKELYNHLRNIQPSLIINNRVGKGRQGMEGMNAYEDAAGDFGTPEQEILEGTSAFDWESCMTMNEHWGFNKFDQNFKSTEILIHNLVDIAAKGGNYLLNVGPTGDGRFPEQSIQRLKEIGDWMNVNGEIIHHSRKCPEYKESEHIYYLQSKEGTDLYAVLTTWPGKEVHLRYAQPDEGSEISLLGCNEKISWIADSEAGILVQLPETWQEEARRTIKHAYVLKIKGEQARVAAAPEATIEGKRIEHKSLFSKPISIELNSKTEGAQIYYTVDNSLPNRKSALYSKPINISDATTIKAVTIQDEYVSSPVTTVQLMKTESFSHVQFNNPYSEKYAAQGDLSIADGVFGSESHYTENWLGFEGKDLDVILDLGRLKSINKVKANFLENTKSWIFLPTSVTISVSVDGTNYSTVKVMDLDAPNVEGKAQSQLIDLHFQKTEVRYIRVVAKNLGVCPEWHVGAGSKAWIFIDEIIIE
jgi:alpha-L-fucosidase